MGDRIKVEVVVQKQQTATVNQLDEEASNQNHVVDEFPDVFMMNCQVFHLIVTLNLLLNYYLKLHL
jgi:heme oxygenase